MSSAGLKFQPFCYSHFGTSSTAINKVQMRQWPLGVHCLHFTGHSVKMLVSAPLFSLVPPSAPFLILYFLYPQNAVNDSSHSLPCHAVQCERQQGSHKMLWCPDLTGIKVPMLISSKLTLTAFSSVSTQESNAPHLWCLILTLNVMHNWPLLSKPSSCTHEIHCRVSER